MHDDELMNDVLRAAMSTPVPAVSPTFTREVERRTAPRRFTPVGRIVVGAYAFASVALCAWLVRDLPVPVAFVALVVQAVAAVALRSYTNHLAASGR